MDTGPISTAFILPTGEFGDRARRVLEVVDLIHRVGPLPRVPIDHRVEVAGADGQYRFRRHRGEARGIGISQTAPSFEFVLLHEIGHFLDHQALGNRGGFASTRHAALKGWRTAVESTWACRTLREVKRVRDQAGRPGGPVVYLLDYNELWARSYAQYVTLKSRDAALLSQLDQQRVGSAPLQRLAQWQGVDFAPVGDAIEALLRRKGWLV